MAAYTAQPLLGASRLITPKELPAEPQDVLDGWVNERRPTHEMRLALQARSNFTFIEDVVTELGNAIAFDGLPATLALGAVAVALSDPSMAVAVNRSDHTHAAHSVLIRRNEQAGLLFEMLITVRVQIRHRHVPQGGQVVVPPEVVKHSVSYALFDMDDEDELGGLLRHYVQVVKDIGPQRARRNLGHTVVVLGDLGGMATAGLPDDWQEEIEYLAEAFDAKVIFGKGPMVPEGVPNRLMRLFVLDPYSGSVPSSGDEDSELPLLEIDGRNNGFAEVFSAIAVSLKQHEPDIVGDPFAPRELKPGEHVYHRKVGNSRGGYDNFNEGSRNPCSHQKGFKRYHKAIQATKGFKRRYTNFDESWLYHCSEGGCGVYAVFVPGARADPEVGHRDGAKNM